MKTRRNFGRTVALIIISAAYLVHRTLSKFIDTNNKTIELANAEFHPSFSFFHLPKYISMSNIAILPLPDLPEWKYQCALKLLEYLSMQKAVILSDIESHREIVKQDKSAIFIKIINEQETAKAIMYAYEHKMYLNRMGVDGRKIVEERYVWENVAKDFDDYLSKLS